VSGVYLRLAAQVWVRLSGESVARSRDRVEWALAKAFALWQPISSFSRPPKRDAALRQVRRSMAISDGNFNPLNLSRST
jgi:hypothetical protein